MGSIKLFDACPEPAELCLLALGAEEPEEVPALQAHLERCARCRLTLAELQAAAELVAYATPAAVPPAGMRERVLDHVTRRPQSDAAPRRSRWSGRLTGWMPFGAAAAVALLALSTGVLGSRVQSLRTQLARAEVWEHVAYEWALAAEQANKDPRVKVIPMANSPEAAGSGGTVYMVPSQTGTRVVISVWGLHQPRGENVYHLWLIRDGERRSGGTFVTDADGRGGAVLNLPGVDFQQVGITLEPDARGMTPRGQKVLGASL